LFHRGREAEGEALLQEALRSARDTFGDDHPTTPLLLINLARIQTSRGRFAEADGTAREALEASRRLHGGRHPRTLAAMA
jgi:hypothetical protein